MAFDLESISTGSILRPPRIILLGVEKIGKSTFAAAADDSVIIPIMGEEGIDDLSGCGKIPVCSSINEIISWLDFLRTKDHPYRTIAIDSGSALSPLIDAESCAQLGLAKDGEGTTENIMKAGGGWGVGPRQSRVTWRNLTTWLDTLRSERNMVVILIGHVIVRRFDDPNGDSYDQYQWDIHEKDAALLYRWADSILFANTKVVVKEEDAGFGKKTRRGIETNPETRFLYTQKRPAHPGGGRGVYGRLPYEIPFSWAHFRDAVTEAARK